MRSINYTNFHIIHDETSNLKYNYHTVLSSDTYIPFLNVRAIGIVLINLGLYSARSMVPATWCIDSIVSTYFRGSIYDSAGHYKKSIGPLQMCIGPLQMCIGPLQMCIGTIHKCMGPI